MVTPSRTTRAGLASDHDAPVAAAAHSLFSAVSCGSEVDRVMISCSATTTGSCLLRILFKSLQEDVLLRGNREQLYPFLPMAILGF